MNVRAISLICLAAALAVGGCGNEGGSTASIPIAQPSTAEFKAAGLGKLALAPPSQRVDLATPPFSNPTTITNPLFPISNLHSVVLNGHIDGQPFHTETTLLPYTRTFQWGGQAVETLVSQYVAFVNGRVDQVALDYYAQADDGAVWYFGEEAYNYDDAKGVIAFTSETWLAGKDGPPAMIMPGHPQVGDVYRTENMPGLTFEEVTVRTTDKVRQGPAGPIHGVMIAKELHDEGNFSPKEFAPGYGEFYTHEGRELEALALAVPTDALNGPLPASLDDLARAAGEAFGASRASDWPALAAAARNASAAWRRYGADNQVPPRLGPPVNDALHALSVAGATHDQQAASTAAIDVSQAVLDLELRYLPPDEVDRGRFASFARQLIADASAGDLGGVSSDMAAMELDRDRFRDSLEPTELAKLNSEMVTLRDAIDSRDLSAARAEAIRILANQSV